MPRTLPIASVLVVLAGCGGGGGGGTGSTGGTGTGGSSGGPAVTLTGVTVAGETSETATVTVKGGADQDAATNRFRVAFACDGGSGSGSLAADPGKGGVQRTHDLPIVARDAALNTATTSLSVTINP